MSLHASSRQQLTHTQLSVPPPSSVESRQGLGQGLGLTQEIDYFATTNTSALTQPTFVPSSSSGGDGARNSHIDAPRGGRFFGNATAAHVSSSSSSASSGGEVGLGYGTRENGSGGGLRGDGLEGVEISTRKKGGLSFELEATDVDSHRGDHDRDEGPNGDGIRSSHTSHTTPSRHSLDETMINKSTSTPAAINTTTTTTANNSRSHTPIATPTTTGNTLPDPVC